jgi:hypothetical protein
VRFLGRKNTPRNSRAPAAGTKNRSGKRIASRQIATAATDRGLRLAQAAGRVRVGIASHNAAMTVPMRPQAPRHIVPDPLVEIPGNTQSSTAVVSSAKAITPTTKRRTPAFGSSMVSIMTRSLAGRPTIAQSLFS